MLAPGSSTWYLGLRVLCIAHSQRNDTFVRYRQEDTQQIIPVVGRLSILRIALDKHEYFTHIPYEYLFGGVDTKLTSCLL